MKKIIEDSVEEYHKLHPNITIEQDGVTGEQYKTKIKTAFAAGEAPDISYMFSGGSFVKPYIDAGYLLPIDEYLSEETKSKVLPGMLDGCTFDGKVYTLPTVTFLANLYCNTEMFDKAGAKIPTTWDELLEAIEKLNDAGMTPIMMGEKTGGRECTGMISFLQGQRETKGWKKHSAIQPSSTPNRLSKRRRRCRSLSMQRHSTKI